jgi:hypothetical protein
MEEPDSGRNRGPMNSSRPRRLPLPQLPRAKMDDSIEFPHGNSGRAERKELHSRNENADCRSGVHIESKRGF